LREECKSARSGKIRQKVGCGNSEARGGTCSRFPHWIWRNGRERTMRETREKNKNEIRSTGQPKRIAGEDRKNKHRRVGV